MLVYKILSKKVGGYGAAGKGFRWISNRNYVTMKAEIQNSGGLEK